MNKREFDLIIKKVVYYGNHYLSEIEKLEIWCQEEYGCNWSELDCDNIIDSLEFGCGMLNPITFEQFKKEIEDNLQTQKSGADL